RLELMQHAAAQLGRLLGGLAGRRPALLAAVPGRDARAVAHRPVLEAHREDAVQQVGARALAAPASGGRPSMYSRGRNRHEHMSYQLPRERQPCALECVQEDIREDISRGGRRSRDRAAAVNIHATVFYDWRAREVSNPQPPDPKSGPARATSWP